MTAHSSQRTSNSTRILVVLGAGVGIFGLLWATCYIVSAGLYPILGAGVGNILIALVLVVAGVVLIVVGATRPRAAR
jgi:hypothetical protein